jgi:hypothetical protein
MAAMAVMPVRPWKMAVVVELPAKRRAVVIELVEASSVWALCCAKPSIGYLAGARRWVFQRMLAVFGDCCYLWEVAEVETPI